MSTIWSTSAPVKAAFFDVDGTLLSFKDHRVPETALIALSELAKSGVRCFLATGRAPYQVDEMPIDCFEAFILFNGQLCLNRDEVFHDECLDRRDVAAVVGQVKAGLYNCVFMERGRCYASGHDDGVRAIEQASGVHFPDGNIDEALENDIYQLNVYLDPGQTDIAKQAASHCKFTRWSPHFVDVFPQHGGKHAAVRRTLERYGIRPEEAIAFGDGGNDLSMFGVVGTSVAMGNGNPEVREQADYVTDDVDADGIYNACFRLGLL